MVLILHFFSQVWREAPADLQRSLFSHFLELLGPGRYLLETFQVLSVMQFDEDFIFSLSQPEKERILTGFDQTIIILQIFLIINVLTSFD